MNHQEFDDLWRQAEAEGYARRLAAGYPDWRRNQRRTVGIALTVAVAIAVSVPLLIPSASGDYEQVYCNRTGTTDTQWADLAAEMLTETT